MMILVRNIFERLKNKSKPLPFRDSADKYASTKVKFEEPIPATTPFSSPSRHHPRRKLSTVVPIPSEEIETDLTLAQAIAFIDLLYDTTCVMDRKGKILAGNSAFLDTMSVAANFLGVITAEDSIAFSRDLLKLESPNCNAVDGVYTMNCQFDDDTPKVGYSWHLATAPCKAFIVATGRPHYEDPLSSFSPEEYLSDAYALRLSTNNSKPSKNQPKFVAAVQTFLDTVEADAHKAMELKAVELKAEALENTLEMKRVFVRHVSHEIRTPLNIVTSGLSYLCSLKSQMSAEVQEVIDEVRSACGTAIDVTNDILTYEKIDSNILTLDIGPTDFVEVVTNVCSMFQIQARSARIELILDVSALHLKHLIVDGDSSKLAQVFRNLVSNALKFTPTGGRVTAVVTENVITKRVRVEVQDTGPGMKKEDRARLFNEIVQFDAKLLQNGQGSGLGLYLSRKVIDMHGGSIGVDQEWEGVGSKFYIELGVSVTAYTERERRLSSFKIHPSLSFSDDAAIQPTLRLLVVDDVALCRKFHRKILGPSCAEIVEAANGQEAVDRVREAVKQGASMFHGILIDNSMPVMNGIVAVRHIRDAGYTGRIFGVTGNGFQSDIDDFLMHGADEVLVKPVGMEGYAHIIATLH